MLLICKGDGWWCRLSHFFALGPRTNCFLTPSPYIHKMRKGGNFLKDQWLLRGEFCLEHRIWRFPNSAQWKKIDFPFVLYQWRLPTVKRSTRLKWSLKHICSSNKPWPEECMCFGRKYSALCLLSLRGCCILDDCHYCY